ncbi:MAG: LLM class flavin-dependent oxidoreductase [Natronomonas sp.]
MKFGIFVPPETPGSLEKHARMAEEEGFEIIGLGDSQSIWRDVYASLATVARATDDVRIGPTVTNPVTRHPAVTASAICTIEELSDGRAILGMGSGDSSVQTLGERPARLADLEEHVSVQQTLCRGQPAEYDDATVKIEWIEDAEPTPEIPVFLGAEGPKTLELAGRVADGVFIGTGLFPELIEESSDRVAAGANAAGRDPDEIETWVLAKANVRETTAKAVDEIKMALAASANHAFRFSLDGKRVPEEYRDPIRQLQEEYVSHEHEELGETRNKELVEELGLTEYLNDRFAVAGTPEDCRKKLERIDSVPGIDGVLLTAYTDDRARFISQFGNEVLPDVS